MTDDELAEARRLCEAATPGPWDADLDMFSEFCIEATVSNETASMLFTCSTDFTGHHRADGRWTEEDSFIRDATWRNARRMSKELRDAHFIAASRTLVPRLLDFIATLRADNAMLLAGGDADAHVATHHARELARLGALVAELRARIATIADGSFGPFPVQSAEDAMTAIERGVAELRAENERLRPVYEAAKRCRSAADAGDDAALEDAEGELEMAVDAAETKETGR